MPQIMSNAVTSRLTNMENSSHSPSCDENYVDSKSPFVNSIEMNDIDEVVDPILPKSCVPVVRATVVKYALEKFENAHITIFQVR